MLHIFYYKTAKGNEVDFAAGEGSDIQLIQIRWEMGEQDKTRQREIKNLLDGMEELRLQQSWIITAYEEEEYEDKETGRVIHIVPAYTWLLR